MSAIRNPGTVFEILQASFPLSEHMYHGCAHCDNHAKATVITLDDDSPFFYLLHK